MEWFKENYLIFIYGFAIVFNFVILIISKIKSKTSITKKDLVELLPLSIIASESIGGTASEKRSRVIELVKKLYPTLSDDKISDLVELILETPQKKKGN